MGANTLKVELSITSLSVEKDLSISGSEMDLETPVHMPKTSESFVDSTTLKEDPKPEESALLNCNLWRQSLSQVSNEELNNHEKLSL